MMYLLKNMTVALSYLTRAQTALEYPKYIEPVSTQSQYSKTKAFTWSCLSDCKCHPFWGQSLAEDKASVSPEGCAVSLDNVTPKLSQGFSASALDLLIKKILQLWLPLTLVLMEDDRIVSYINMTKVVFQQEMPLLQCFKLGRMYTEIPDVE